MKKTALITVDTSNNYLVQFSEKCILEKNVCLTVPRGYVAIAYINGKALYKSNQCVNEKIIERCGKEYLGKEIQFAFYSPGFHPEISYGFGPINAKNDKLKEAYRVGINGQMIITIKDFIELINYFAFTDSITVEDVRERILPIIKSVGIPIVGALFANTMVSVFEIDSMIGEIREKMTKAFVSENALKKLGIQVDSVAINEVFVNEEDLEMIRERINN